jgi:cell division protease FtsH
LYERTLKAMAGYREWMVHLKNTLMERYVLSKDEVFDLLACLKGSDCSGKLPADNRTAG